jgi:hypothetical protein
LATHPDRDTALGLSLSDLSEHWLGLHCRCGKLAQYPVKLLASRRGDGALVRDVLPKLHCPHCKSVPERIYLTDDPTGGVPGGTWWAVDLFP